MGTVAGSTSQAGILAGSWGQWDGRRAYRCDHCGRGQFDRGQDKCIVCHYPLLIPLEPLPDSDAEASLQAYCSDQGRWIAARLRKLRLLLDLSQRELSQISGCVRSHISKYERGMIILHIASLERLAVALDLDMAELLDERIGVRDLAVLSLARSPLTSQLMSILPQLGQHSRDELVEAAKSFSRA